MAHFVCYHSWSVVRCGRSKEEAADLMSAEVNYAKTKEYPVGADQLFRVMMRLEFALKEIGYCRPTRNQSAAVDWDRFTNERLGAAFFNAIAASGKAKILIDTPPKRQSVDNHGHLRWEQTGAVSNIQELIGSLRRVRNNLFHGGKSGDPDRDRNDALVSNALSVVNEILKHDRELRMIFEGNY